MRTIRYFFEECEVKSCATLHFINKTIAAFIDSMGNYAIAETGLTYLKEVEHPALGTVFHMRDEGLRSQFYIKQIVCESEESLSFYLHRLRIASCYRKEVPTLLQLIKYEIFPSRQGQSGSRGCVPQCLASNRSTLLLRFNHYPLENTLSCIIARKKAEIQGNVFNFSEEVKMCDYEKIDNLNPKKRQYINIFFQQIEILRMIDHLLGAIYYLHHIQISHAGIRAENVILTQDGKFLLADRQLLQGKSNYQICFESKGAIMDYFCPQHVKAFNAGDPKPTLNKTAGDIFGLGLLTLEMCLLEDFNFTMLDADQKITFLRSELNMKITNLKRRYSNHLGSIIGKMLKSDPNERISIMDLIQQLNPALSRNINALNKIYQNDISLSVSDFKVQEFGQEDPLMRRLKKVQDRFQKIMKNKFILERSCRELKKSEQKMLTRLGEVSTTKGTLHQLQTENSQRASQKRRKVDCSTLLELYKQEYQQLQRSKN